MTDMTEKITFPRLQWRDIITNNHYRPPTKLWEGNVVTDVCLFTGKVGITGCRSLPGGLVPCSFGRRGRISLVPCPLWEGGAWYLDGGEVGYPVVYP